MKSNLMRALLLGGAMVLTTVTGALAQQPEIKVLKTERSGNVSYLLFQVDNPSDRNFTSSQWSCVFFDNATPVHEERSIVDHVPARGRAVQRIIQGYGGPFTKIECRFLEAR
jgi:hypothetical protein